MFSSISLACLAGKYGPGCKYDCSTHCRDGAPCNTTTGACDTGCEAGYTGKMCDKGYFKCILQPLLLAINFSVQPFSRFIQYSYCAAFTFSVVLHLGVLINVTHY